MAGKNVTRNEKGQVLKGSVLNAGGRSVTREHTFGKTVWTATGEGSTLRAELLHIAGDRKHPKQFEAIKELLARTLGAPSKTPFLDEDATPEFTEQELLELAEGYVAQAREKAKENTNEVRPDDRAAPEVSAVQVADSLRDASEKPVG